MTDPVDTPVVMLPQRYEPLVPLDQLHRHPANANEGDTGLLHLLVGANGWAGAVMAQESTGILVDGETRLDVAEQTGMPGLPVIWLDIDDDTRDRLLAEWNESGRRGMNNPGKLLALLEGLAVTSRGLDGTGFDGDHVDALKALLTGNPPLPNGDPDEAPLPPAEPVTAPGDLWRLADHTLLCGDAFDPGHVARLVAGKRADLVLTDPPFAIYGSASGISSDVADDKMVRPFFEAMWRVIAGNLKRFGHAYVHCDWRSWASLWETAKRAKMAPRNMLVWDKGGSGLGANYANTHELIAFFARLPTGRTMTSGMPAGQRTVFRSNVLRYDRPTGEDRLHNAAKPVDLLAELIGNSTDPGQVVLDLYAGSGSTLIAAHLTGRACLALEIDPAQCDVTLARFAKVAGIDPVREHDGATWTSLHPDPVPA